MELADRLGLANGQKAGWVGLPAGLSMLALARSYARSELVARARELSPRPFDMIHLFSLSRATLAAELPLCAERLAPGGRLWVSWPRAGSGLPSDLDAGAVAALAGEAGLEAQDAIEIAPAWAALPLVLREG